MADRTAGLENKTTKLQISLITGKKEDGSNKTKIVTLNNINPEASDADLLDIAISYGNLQQYTVEEYTRVDQGELMYTD